MRKHRAFNIHRAACKTLRYLGYVCCGVALAALVGVIVFVLIDGIGAITPSLLFGRELGSPTILPAFAGTLSLIAISCLIAVPLGVASAVYLTEYADNKGRFVRMIRVATETLAGIPSIVYGLFGYIVFVVVLGWGYSLLAGGITLAVMILPQIVRSAEESLLAVPASYREGAYALGAGKVRTIFKIVLPAASGGIVTAVILAVGRVVSESAVLILTIGMVVDKLPGGLMSPGTSLALDIYYFANFGYPKEAAATSAVLLIFVLAINALAEGLGKLIKRKAGGID